MFQAKLRLQKRPSHCVGRLDWRSSRSCVSVMLDSAGAALAEVGGLMKVLSHSCVLVPLIDRNHS